MNLINKKSFILLIVLAFSIVSLLSINGCEGPEGPAGADGIDGIDGTDGTDGTDGVAGNLSCLGCHTSAKMDTIETSFSLSGHAAGHYVGYAGSRGSCARCHSHEGFMDFLAGYPGEDIANPSAWRCGTCHGNHRSLEDNITAPLNTDGPIASISIPGTTYDFGNSSNLCGTCHQSRRAYTYYEEIDSVWTDDVNGNDSLDFVVPDGQVYINSSHAGPHHGPQVNVLFGEGGYGTSSTDTHSTLGCVSCHMGETGVTDGGHTFNPNVASCNVEGCHTDVTDFDIDGAQTTFNTRMTAIAEALVTAGALSYDADDESYHPVKGLVSNDVFQAFYNYMICYEDHSHGVHNPSYFNTLLTMAEAKLDL
ncbi:MAG: hypothetical protein H8E70_02205 [Candidatus Marinimicrobia bacterium]|nr:hypothetical protein [Candidatus Neomarinimicrobiota bacterium]